MDTVGDCERRKIMADETFRCGWCGHPTDLVGSPIEFIESDIKDDAVLVNGSCCPNGDEDYPRYVARDMAIDAGDLSLEGQEY